MNSKGGSLKANLKLSPYTNEGNIETYWAPFRSVAKANSWNED